MSVQRAREEEEEGNQGEPTPKRPLATGAEGGERTAPLRGSEALHLIVHFHQEGERAYWVAGGQLGEELHIFLILKTFSLTILFLRVCSAAHEVDVSLSKGKSTLFCVDL